MELESYNDGTRIQQEKILREAEMRYGSDAFFVYPRPADRQLVTMTLEQAMAICGRHMASEDAIPLWATLDKWHEAARRLKSKRPELFEKSIELGKNALRARGIKVGDSSEESE